jgi:hypothetical protein
MCDARGPCYHFIMEGALAGNPTIRRVLMSTIRSWAVLVCAVSIVACGQTTQISADGGGAGVDGSFDAGSQDGTAGMDGGHADGGPTDAGHDAGPATDAPPPFDSGTDAGPCGMCPGMEVCCTDPTAPGYGQCYSPGCLACCMGGPPPFDGGSQDAGDPCGNCPAGEVCCASSSPPHCYPQGCLACCMGPPPSDAGDLCGACPANELCCMTPGAPRYGQCYPPQCLSCCM